jgi:hypothetical protein
MKKNIYIDLDYIQEIGRAHEWCGLFENHFLSLIKEQGEMSSRICDFRGNCPKEASRRSIVKGVLSCYFVKW